MKEQLAQTQMELEEVREAVITLADSIKDLATKEEVGAAYVINQRRRKRWTTGLFIIGVLIFSALVSQGLAARNNADSSRDRARASCATINNNKDVITKILDRAQQSQGSFPGLTDEQLKAITANNVQFRKDIAPLLRPVDCEDFAKHPEHYVNGLK